MAHDDEQERVERFLITLLSTPGQGVRRFETHGAIVLVGASEAFKFKRRVQYSYMDFSTLEQRRRACAREIEVNQPHAPQIYIGLAGITRDGKGRLALDGAGDTIEWAVRMRSFPQEHVLSNLIGNGPLSPTLAKALADMVVGYHETTPCVMICEAAAQISRVVSGLDAVFLSHQGVFPAAMRRRWREGVDARLAAATPLLEKRAREGYVRRVHGDLHLGNIVLWEGRPVAFDAIEFDERMATIDTLYDLAFLLMDLDRHAHRDTANLVLNRYLWRRQSPGDLAGLSLLPLFLSVRAGVRAMVGAQRADLQPAVGQQADWRRANEYLDMAERYLSPAAPELVAIGGLSGTGKSTLAAEVAPHIGGAPGAVHLRSDLERKAMLGVGELDRVGTEGYAPEVSHRVYDRLAEKARAILGSGQAVVVDAVFAEHVERDRLRQIAAEAGAPFAGLWLEAPAGVMKDRVASRTGDASDATPDVVASQIARGAGNVGWFRIDASADRNAVVKQARAVLGRQIPGGEK